MTFNLQKIDDLVLQWNRFAEAHTQSSASQSRSEPLTVDFETPSEKFLREITELNVKTQAVIDNIPLSLPTGLQKQKESKSWHGALVNLSTQSLRSIRLLEGLLISEENEPEANQVLANCLGTATTTLALAKTFRFLISSSYEPEVNQMIAQAFGNHDLAPVHEIKKVPKTAVKRVLEELYGDEIVKKVFKLYNLNKASDITGDNLRVLLIGILANLDEAALKHIVTHKERHKQITAFAFFDEFLTRLHSTVEKRFDELRPEELTGFLDCLRKSLLDLDIDLLFASQADYRGQLLRDLNLLCFCSQATIHPHFSISLNSVLTNFPRAGQIKGTLIPISDQNFLPLSQILQLDDNEGAAASSSSGPTSFFPKETLSCHLNNDGLHRISGSAAAATEQESSSYPARLSSRTIPSQSIEPFEFLQTRHPLVVIAGMIEKMRSGKLSIIAAQRFKIELDAESKSLFKRHESALFEDPAPFFHLYDLVERMEKGTLLPDKSAVLAAFQMIADPLRHSLARKIYELSDNPSKKIVRDWGEVHAVDDLSLLLKAIIGLKNSIFDFSYEKIKAHATTKLSSLSVEKRIGVHYEIYRIAKPFTDDPNWGENNALAKVSRLVAALHIRGALPGPQLVSYRERVAEPRVLPQSSLTSVISSDLVVPSEPFQTVTQIPVLMELPKPKEIHPRKHPLAELASMIENMRSGAFSFVDAQNVAIHLDSEVEELFAKHELALINDPSVFFNLSELVRQMTNGAAIEDQEVILRAFQRISDPLRQSLARQIYQFSKDSTKGNVPNWGEVHAADDLACLKQAIDKLTNQIFDSVYSKITKFASSKLSALQKSEQVQVYHEIYRTGNPTSDDPDWGEKNALVVTSRLIEALHFIKAIHVPEPVGNKEASFEGHGHRHPPSIFLTPSRGDSHSRPLKERKLETLGALFSPQATPLAGLPSPSKSIGNVGSLERAFAITSPFSPKKSEKANISPSVVRILFPSSFQQVVPQAVPSSLPPPPLMPPVKPLAPLLSSRSNPEELHQKSELSRLKRECEARLKFSDMYKAAPLSESDLEKIFRLEGQISSCRTTINLLQKQGAETEFSLSIVKALNSSILENEAEIKRIKASAPITLKDFDSFKNQINNFTSSELKLILHEVCFELQEVAGFDEISSELYSFYNDFPNQELKKIVNENSEFYKKLLVEGPGRYVSHLLATLKARTSQPELEPVHEIRPFRRNKNTSSSRVAEIPKKPAAAIDMSEIANFRFKLRERSGSVAEKEQAGPLISSPRPLFPTLRKRDSRSSSHLDQMSQSSDPIDIKRQSQSERRQRRIEEAQQAKFEQMRVDYLREKLVALANACLKPDLLSTEEERDLEGQLRLIDPTPENLLQRQELEEKLGAVQLKIRLKKEEEENAKQFIIHSHGWTTAMTHPFATLERLAIASEYAEKQMKNVQGRV